MPIGDALTWIAAFVRRARDDRAASLVEYALLVGLIAMVCVLAVTFLGGSASTSYSRSTSSMFIGP